MADHICPVWVGRLMANPLRKLFQSPTKILEPFVRPGMTVLDVGCAMGFFSLPLAKMVGAQGRVICVDVQEGMVRSLERRARRAGVADQVQLRQCTEDSLECEDLHGLIDFALAFAMVHEMDDVSRFFDEVHSCLVPKGRLLVSAPRVCVIAQDFEGTVALAERAGFVARDRPRIRGTHSVLLSKAQYPCQHP